MITIRGGHTIEVWRRPRAADRFGDKEEVKVGTIDHVVVQWASASSAALRFHPSDKFEETASLSAVLFCPSNAAIRLQARDRIVMGGRKFQVVGERAWDEPHPMTGTDFGYYMMQVETVG
ncbi:hypothetical protein MINTM005_13270 [Mycobacterium intracellulare]|uniref:hypothetical protein n=1 Tax=Mycobacterium intracellulare TaxID=1767 RepID=UPI001927DA26|nr:hypothetical protein [Mycobacterium intracellulare]BCO56083.1 hypothetical protein MINTM005_13270 [Mycobacterium intracellulare]